MKRFISIVSAFAMLSAVPMSASAEDAESGADYFDAIVETILTDLSLYDFNADGTTNFVDVQLIFDFYSYTQTGYMETNVTADGVTYNFLVDRERVELSDDVIQSVLATANVTNPEWDPERNTDGYVDGVDALDGSFLLNALSNYYDLGDVNADGAVDSLDASTVLKHYSMFQAERGRPDESEMSDEVREYFSSIDRTGVSCLGDVNGDGEVNALDASEILAGYAAAQTA